MVKAETTMTTTRRKTVTRMKTVKKSLALDIQLFVYTVETAHTREETQMTRGILNIINQRKIEI